MPVYRNLPGIRVFKEDQNLLVAEMIPGELTVVIGTSPAGPREQLYLVRDPQTAMFTFDPEGSQEGTLIQGMLEAGESGSRYLALFRIGSTPAILDFVNGYKIQVEDGSSVKIFYDFSSGAHDLKLTHAVTGEVVYDNINGIDTGFAIVDFNKEITNSAVSIGTESSPVVLSSVNTAIGAANSITYAAGAKTISYPSAVLPLAAGMIITITGGDTADDGDYEVLYVKDEKATLVSKKVGDKWVPFDGFTAKNADDTKGQIKTRYFAQNDGTKLTQMEMFEALAKAYFELENIQCDMVIPASVYVDAPNLVNNIGQIAVPAEEDFLGMVYQFEHEGELFHIWKTGANVSDRIVPKPYALGIDGVHAEKLVDGNYPYEVIMNDTPLSGLTESDKIVKFNEANFAHQLGEYLYGLSLNQTEALGSIAMRPPTSLVKREVVKWVGKAPITDANGNITVSGTGLLGYKYMAGSTGVKAGFYHTATGFVDGDAVLDHTGKPVDLGKYLVITALPLIHTGAAANTAAGYLGGAAADYAGFIMSLDEKDAPTNKKMKSTLSLPIALQLKNSLIDQLVGTRYTVFASSFDNSVKVVDAPTAARPNSDYTRVLTVRIVALAIDMARKIAEPFIGGLNNGEIRNALEEQENSMLHNLKQFGYLNAGLAQVRATRDQEIKGEGIMRLILNVPGELRQLYIYVNLTK